MTSYGVLGTGTVGEVREPFASAIRIINKVGARGAKVMAVDLPSGLDCDTGAANEPTIKATFTATFVAPKIGFAAASARPCLGEVRVFSSLGGIIELLRTDQKLIGSILLIFSVIFPFAKLASLLIATSRLAPISNRGRKRLHFLASVTGKYSLLDILVVAPPAEDG